MKSLDIFLRALEHTYKERNIILIPRWYSVRDEKFPAYMTYSVEVIELCSGEKTQRFMVQHKENMSENSYITKEEKESVIKENLTKEIMCVMLKYYMYGNTVQ